MITNSVEGFHGLALMYWDKKADLGHTYYVCKTNMAVCHKVRCCDKIINMCILTCMTAEYWSHMEADMLC